MPQKGKTKRMHRDRPYPEVGLVGERHLLGGEEVHRSERGLMWLRMELATLASSSARPGLPSQQFEGLPARRTSVRLPREGRLQALQMVAQALGGHARSTISVAASASPAAASRALGARAPWKRSSAPHQQGVVSAALLLRQPPLHQRWATAAQLPAKAASFSVPAGPGRQTAPGRPPPLGRGHRMPRRRGQ